MLTQVCKDCGAEHPLNREFFGNYSNNGVVGFRRTCRQCMRDRSAKHAAANPKQRIARGRRRSQREQNSGSDLSHIDVDDLRRSLDDACRYCGSPLSGGGELDHLTPVARGGSGQPGNVTVACMKCNRAKLAKTLTEFIAWRQERGLLVRHIQVAGEVPDLPAHSMQRRSF